MDNSVIEYQRSSWNAVKDRLGAGEALYIGDTTMSLPVLEQQLNNQAISTSTEQEAEETTCRNEKTTMMEGEFLKIIEDWENELMAAEEKKNKSGLEESKWTRNEVVDKAIQDEEILWNRISKRVEERKESEPDDDDKDLNISYLQRIENEEEMDRKRLLDKMIEIDRMMKENQRRKEEAEEETERRRMNLVVRPRFRKRRWVDHSKWLREAKEEAKRQQEEQDKIRNSPLWEKVVEQVEIKKKEEQNKLKEATELEREIKGDERFLKVQRHNWDMRKQILENERKKVEEEEERNRQKKLWDETIKEVELKKKEEEGELQDAAVLERERRGDERFLEVQRQNWELRKQIWENEKKKVEEEDKRNREKKLWDQVLEEVEKAKQKVNFACTDVRYIGKTAPGYCVIPGHQ